jgi:Bacterial antitoxin of type II TA system, VapB
MRGDRIASAKLMSTSRKQRKHITIELSERCLKSVMVTQLNVNESLLQEALALDDQATIDALVETALREYIQRRKRLKMLDLFGTIDYDEAYDYKQQRQQA